LVHSFELERKIIDMQLERLDSEEKSLAWPQYVPEYRRDVPDVTKKVQLEIKRGRIQRERHQWVQQLQSLESLEKRYADCGIKRDAQA